MLDLSRGFSCVRVGISSWRPAQSAQYMHECAQLASIHEVQTDHDGLMVTGRASSYGWAGVVGLGREWD